MPTFTEDVSDSMALSGTLGPHEHTSVLCSPIFFADALSHRKDYSVAESFAVAAASSFNIGYNVAERIVLAGSASKAATTTGLATAGIVLHDMVSQVLAASPSASFALTATATASTDTPVSAGFALGAVATGVRFATNSVSNSLEIGDAVVTVVVHNETESFHIGVVPQVELDVALTDSVGLGQSASPLAIATALVEAALSLSQSCTQGLVANAAIADGFALTDRPLIIDASYPSIWANSERMATAVWKQTPYESYAFVGGQLLAAGEDGIYAHGYAQDDTGVVRALVKGDLSDFNSENKKVLGEVNVAGTCGAPLRITVTTELGSYSYTTHLPNSTHPRTHQAKPGRGLTGRYVRYSIDNLSEGGEGADFSINEIVARVGDSSRVR